MVNDIRYMNIFYAKKIKGNLRFFIIKISFMLKLIKSIWIKKDKNFSKHKNFNLLIF